MSYEKESILDLVERKCRDQIRTQENPNPEWLKILLKVEDIKKKYQPKSIFEIEDLIVE